jgi:hypothetical protein
LAKEQPEVLMVKSPSEKVPSADLSRPRAAVRVASVGSNCSAPQNADEQRAAHARRGTTRSRLRGADHRGSCRVHGRGARRGGARTARRIRRGTHKR